MAGISRYEAAALGLTAAFVLFTAGWFFASHTQSEPYTVTVQQAADSASSSAAQPQDTSASQPPESLLEGERIPINTADVHDLDRLPGIGPTKAQAIVDYRTEHGPFQSTDQLLEVSGIGEATLEGLLDYITLD